MKKFFVLVSQGIEIMRTESQEKAINYVKEANDKYFDYLQKCYDNYERPADNYIDLEIEYIKEYECMKSKNCPYDCHCIFTQSNIDNYLNGERPLCLGGEDVTIKDLKEC